MTVDEEMQRVTRVRTAEKLNPEPGEQVELTRVRCYGKHDTPCTIDVPTTSDKSDLKNTGWEWVFLPQGIGWHWLCPFHVQAVSDGPLSPASEASPNV